MGKYGKGDTSWFTHDRFGMFIHFGLYAVPARHEWVKSIEAISDATYDSKYLPRFNPDLYDAREWAGAAKAAGIGAGIYKDRSEAFSSLGRLGVVEPSADRSRYLEAYSIWKNHLNNNI